MEHPCHRCGATIVEGSPFCPQCGAPQIKVNIPGPTSGAPAPLTPDVLPETAPSASDRRQRWTAAAIPGIILGLAFPWLFGLLRLASLFFLALAGAVAVVLYRHRAHPAPVSAGAGAALGALSGFVSYLVQMLLLGVYAFVDIVINRKGGELAAELRNALRASVAGNPDPNARQMVEQIMTPEGLTVLVLFVAIFLLLLMVGSATVGGALGAAFGARKRR